MNINILYKNYLEKDYCNLYAISKNIRRTIQNLKFAEV